MTFDEAIDTEQIFALLAVQGAQGVFTFLAFFNRHDFSIRLIGCDRSMTGPEAPLMQSIKTGETVELFTFGTVDLGFLNAACAASCSACGSTKSVLRDCGSG